VVQKTAENRVKSERGASDKVVMLASDQQHGVRPIERDVELRFSAERL